MNKSTTIYWAGDSTVQYNNFTTYPQTGLGQVLGLFLRSDVMISNHAKNGRSTKSFIDQSRLVPIYNDITAGDFLFIQFGHNDEKINDPDRYTRPFVEYKENLVKMINLARNKGAYPVLITPLVRRLYDGKGGIDDGHGEYPAAMKEVAAEQNVPLIDLQAKSTAAVLAAGEEVSKHWHMNFEPGVFANFPEGKADNSHLQYAGAYVYCGLIAEGLRELGGIYADLLLQDVLDRAAYDKETNDSNN